VLRVRDGERAQELLGLCDSRGWVAVVGVEPGKPENISDLTRLLEAGGPAVAPALPGRNDPCHCGSGRKFKKCCGSPGAALPP